MLTSKRLIELGFEKKSENKNTYYEKDKFCLFSMSGKWLVGSDFGTLATSNTYIETEEELIKYMKE